jgi:hypothetical protein
LAGGIVRRREPPLKPLNIQLFHLDVKTRKAEAEVPSNIP